MELLIILLVVILVIWALGGRYGPTYGYGRDSLGTVVVVVLLVLALFWLTGNLHA